MRGPSGPKARRSPARAEPSASRAGSSGPRARPSPRRAGPPGPWDEPLGLRAGSSGPWDEPLGPRARPSGPWDESLGLWARPSGLGGGASQIAGRSTRDQGCQIESERERPVELKPFLRREMANVVGEDGLRQADQLIAVNAAVVLESLLDADRNLAVKTVPAGVDRRADHAGKAGIEEKLTAYDDEYAGSPRVEGRGVSDPVEITSPQGMTWYSSTSAASSLSSAAWELMISRSPASSPRRGCAR